VNSYERMRSQAAGGVQPNLNLQIIKALSLPVPPGDEQIEITKLLDDRISEIDQQRGAVAQSIRQAAAQRQNILRAAFAGELVPQDPDDEPASALLARIRAERAADAVEKKPR